MHLEAQPHGGALQARRLQVSDAEVLRYADAGESQRAIATMLGVSRRSVRDAIARARAAEAKAEAVASKRRVEAVMRQAKGIDQPSTPAPARKSAEPRVESARFGRPDTPFEEGILGTLVNEAALARALWSSGPMPPYDPNAFLNPDPVARIEEQRANDLVLYVGALCRYGYIARDGEGLPYGYEAGEYFLLPSSEGQPFSESDLTPLLRRVRYDAKADRSWATERDFYAPRTPLPYRIKVGEYTIGDG